MKSSPIAFVLAGLVAWFGHAAEVSSDDALCAVRGWVNLKEALGGDFDANPASVTAYDGEDGKGKFYVVTLEGGGYVVASGDDEVTPILAYSREGTFEASEKNPLWCLLAGRAALEAERLAASTSTTSRISRLSGVSGVSGLSGYSGNSANWSRLRAAGGGASGGKVRLGKSASAPTDLRVPELLHSDWSQEEIGNFNNGVYPDCFNLYTPNHWPCGCVATVGSQIMRYFEWPKTSVTAKTFSCTTNGVAVSLKMKGGTYDWANMPPNINTMYASGTSATVTTYRQAIGKLTYDVGVTVNMNYRAGGSSSYASRLPTSFTNVFGYASAVHLLEPSDAELKKAVLPNLDAKLPCGLGVRASSSNSGHAIVADGYGYSGGMLYLHVNSGWNTAQSATAWYTPPTFDFSDNTKYTTVDVVVFNVFTNGSKFASIASGRVLDQADNPVSGATVTAKYSGSVSATAKSDSRGVYALTLPPTSSSRTYSVTATCPGYTNATTVSVSASKTTGDTISNSYGKDITLQRRCAKLVDGTFHFYNDISCSAASELPPAETPASIAGCTVFFANDAEYQELVPYTNELKKAAGGVPYLQQNLTLAADADWRAMDFNLNGKTIVMKGWDLKVRKPRGSGRITSGNILNEESYVFNTGSSADDDWIYLGSGSTTDGLGSRLSAQQTFTLPKPRACYFKTQTKRNTATTYGQYVRVGITGTDDVMPETDYLNGTQTHGPFVRSGLTGGTPYTIKYYWTNGKCYISRQATLSPSSYVYFDIPEGEEYNLKNITLGGSTPGTSDFGGVGLQIRKIGKGSLVMSKANPDFAGSNVVSIVVQNGKVSKTASASATCGGQYSRINVQAGGQFDICGRTYWDYDYNLAGSGPDGKGALIKSQPESEDPQRAYVKAENGFLRNVILSDDAVLWAESSCDWALMYYNYQPTTMKMNGHTLTIDGPAYTGNVGGRIYAGNMSYSGNGMIVIATNGCFQTYDATYKPTAPGCELHVYGMLWAQSTDDTAKMSVISPVKSLIFHESGVYRNLRVASPVTKTIVYERYAPNTRTWSGNTTRLYPAVQLGDASHLNTTLDLSRWTTTFDDSAEGTLTFYAGTTVTLDIGDRTSGLGGYAYLWKTKPASTVKFRRTESMARRGIHIVPGDVGIRFQTGVTIIIR